MITHEQPPPRRAEGDGGDVLAITGWPASHSARFSRTSNTSRSRGS